MGEEGYINKPYCLECETKHLNRAEHHAEDLVTASADDPAMRQNAQKMLDNIRKMRKQVDEMRIEELAKKKLNDI